MKTKLVRIGNSRGVRIPKPLIEQAGLDGDVEVDVKNGAIVITRADHPRAGWANAVTLLLERREDYVLEETPPTRFDEEEWEW
jgi:antitoxin MazE